MTDHQLPDMPPDRVQEVVRRHVPHPSPRPRSSKLRRVVPWIGAACVITLAGLTGWALVSLGSQHDQVSQLQDGQTALGSALHEANHRLRELGGHPVTTPTAVAGSQGPAGPAGSPGPAGTNGSNGSPGRRGKRGASGKPGPSGRAGARGSNGQSGAQGPTGPSGAAGASGPPGPQGVAGVSGAQGPVGPKGDTGASGASGDPGEPPQSWTFSVPGLLGDTTYTCTRDAPFDPDAPTYTCTST